MKNLTSFLKKFGLPFLVFLAIFLLTNTALAAGQPNLGLNEVGNNLILNNASPIVIIGKIIQVLLGLLGIVVVSMFIYAGFIWMTSNGSEEKILTAKKILRNAVVGIIIILSAWGIVYFVLTKLVGITGGVVQTGNTEGNNFKNLSLGALGSCSIETVYPTPDSKEVARNAAILITVKEPLQLDTICINKNTKNPCACDNTANCNFINPKNIQIYKTADGNSCVSANCNTNVVDVEVSVPIGNKTLVLRPLSYLGLSSGNVEYAVRLTNDIKKFGGQTLFSTCSSDFLEWKFETSNKLDLESPQVVLGGIFPPVDNQADIVKSDSSAKKAKAEIVVTDCPRTYQPAEKVSIQKIGSSVEADIIPDSNYSSAVTDFIAQVVSGNKLKLFSGSSLLGATDIVGNQAIFAGYFTLKLTSVVEGNSWNIIIKPAQSAENLTVASNSYIFVDKKTNSGNEILVPAACSPAGMASNMAISLSGNSEVETISTGGTLTLFAKSAGVSGNNLTLLSNARGLSLKKFAGGTEKSSTYEIKGLEDKPMNSIIQVNFNEAVNPMTLSGTADELKSYIKLVNSNPLAKSNGQSCLNNSDCFSYNCQATNCVGDYVSGKFSLSNVYKTLEFVSDKECGVNSCGEIMYCLPASSHLSLKINAASLKSCTVSTDCQAFAPYSECSSGICRDSASKSNYPSADSLKLNGVVDLAFNSLDGNRDKKADGPVLAVYPYFIEGDSNLNKRDGFEFSFFISNKINSTQPTNSLASPRLLESGVKITSPVVIDFNDLMMSSTLRTGGLTMNNGLINTEHKLVNLHSSNDKPLGYWIESDNKEKGVANGEPDYTSTRIMHSDFFEAVTYISQIGSGVKNIYQNCFKPSIGPACISLGEGNPSCCFGSPTNALDKNGNCVN